MPKSPQQALEELRRIAEGAEEVQVPVAELMALYEWLAALQPLIAAVHAAYHAFAASRSVGEDASSLQQRLDAEEHLQRVLSAFRADRCAWCGAPRPPSQRLGDAWMCSTCTDALMHEGEEG
jgi:hypothetical protein